MEKKKKYDMTPNWLAWNFYSTCAKVHLFFTQKMKYHLDVFKNRDKKKGCVVIYNHDSNQDHFITTSSLCGARANYVMTKHFYYTPLLAKVLPMVRAIPREQFKSDTVSIRKMRRVIDHGGVVPISPAGQISIHGEDIYIDPSISKLLKFCNCDIYSFRIRGNYLAFPKWTEKPRKMQIDVDSELVLTKEQLMELSEEEIYKKVCDSIRTNDRTDEIKRVIPGKDFAEGLDKVLYVCPKCHAKYSLTAKNDLIRCTCGYSARRNNLGYLEPVDQQPLIFNEEASWFRFQKEEILKKINDGSFILSNSFDLYLPNETDTLLVKVGTGNLTLTKNSFRYVGSKNNEPYVKDFDLDKLVQLSFSCDERFNVPDQEATFEFRPAYSTNPHVIMEWVQAVDAIHTVRSDKQ